MLLVLFYISIRFRTAGGGKGQAVTRLHSGRVAPHYSAQISSEAALTLSAQQRELSQCFCVEI